MSTARDTSARSATMPEPATGPGSHAADGGRRKGRIAAWARRLALAALLLAVIGVGGGFLLFVSHLERFATAPLTETDGIVVLTGGAQRIGDAADLLAQGRAKRLLISGVNERTSRDQIAHANPELRRVVECCVDLGYRARNTIGNADETRRWMAAHGFRSLIVVTSSYHMPRTLVELGSALPRARLVPHAVVSDQFDAARWWRDLATARLLFLEYVKYVVAVVRTRLHGDPDPTRVAGLDGGRQPIAPAPAAAR